MGYTFYEPLKVWLDPASIADVVAYIQTYLTENPISDEEDIENIVAEYIAAHPELIGGVQSVNGETGEVVLTASDINTSNNTTIQAVLTSLSGQISEIVQTITGLDTRVTKNATGITNEATARANADTALGNRITALQGAVGSPLVAATAAAMTDTSKIYVYTGSETGYTNGNWYYYNGSAWVSGGVYNAVAINTDTTLTVAGMAADAKATGDDLNDLKSSLNTLLTDVNASNLWQSGGITVSNGATSTTSTRIRTREYINDSIVYVFPNSGWDFGIFAYDKTDKSYVGMYDGSSFQNVSLTWLSSPIEIGEFQKIYSIKIVIRKHDNSEITTSDYNKIELYKLSDNTNQNKYIDYTYESDWKTGYINTSGNVGAIVDLYVSTNSQYKYVIIECVKGDVLTITAKGGNASRAWAYTDKNYALIDHAISNYEAINFVYTAPVDGFLIVNGVSTFANGYSVVKRRYLNEENRELTQTLMTPFKKNEIVSDAMPEYRINIDSVVYDRTTDIPLNDLYDAYDALITQFPNYITKTLLGNDASGTYAIYRYDFIPELPIINSDSSTSPKLFNDYTRSDYPTVIMDAGIHGGEKPCVLALLNLMTKIAQSSSDNGILGWLRDNIHFVVIPSANPWGYSNNLRYNYNHVDINRNFPPYWVYGDSDSSSDRYRGASALSEVEAQYINSILTEYKNKAVGYLSWHTFGSFTSYSNMSCFMVSTDFKPNELQMAGIDVIKTITKSGWKNHSLPTNSGFIGNIQLSSIAQYGMSSNQGAYLGIPSCAPEVMYRYYDGNTGADYNTNINCLNAEYMLYSICAVLLRTLY